MTNELSEAFKNCQNAIEGDLTEILEFAQEQRAQDGITKEEFFEQQFAREFELLKRAVFEKIQDRL